MTAIQQRHIARIKASNRARQMSKAFGPEAAYTYLLRRGFSVDAACYILFGE